MRDLIDFTIQCMNELDRIGIPYGNVIDVTINTGSLSISMWFFWTRKTMLTG